MDCWLHRLSADLPHLLHLSPLVIDFPSSVHYALFAPACQLHHLNGVLCTGVVVMSWLTSSSRVRSASSLIGACLSTSQRLAPCRRRPNGGSSSKSYNAHRGTLALRSVRDGSTRGAHLGGSTKPSFCSASSAVLVQTFSPTTSVAHGCGRRSKRGPSHRMQRGRRPDLALSSTSTKDCISRSCPWRSRCTTTRSSTLRPYRRSLSGPLA